MGVLYHRRVPLDHLAELRAALRPGGELVLETLVVEGDRTTILRPDRYAKMRNVWAIPSCALLLEWVAASGFADARLADLAPTRTDEQRRTPWMRFESLADFLDPADPARTIEGHPAPVRAMVVARRDA
jgi:tRNA (mo5U34)-methyltransferase